MQDQKHWIHLKWTKQLGKLELAKITKGSYTVHMYTNTPPSHNLGDYDTPESGLDNYVAILGT